MRHNETVRNGWTKNRMRKHMGSTFFFHFFFWLHTNNAYVAARLNTQHTHILLNKKKKTNYFCKVVVFRHNLKNSPKNQERSWINKRTKTKEGKNRSKVKFLLLFIFNTKCKPNGYWFSFFHSQTAIRF